MKPLLLVGLLMLPHHAVAASIPLVFMFDQLAVKTSPGASVYQPVTPFVMHVVLTFNDAPAGRALALRPRVAAAAVPEPARVLLIASGLALARLRKVV